MSELQSATSRANGAKSKGPKTAEGRQKSSRNAIKHGFTAVSTILTDWESSEEFFACLESYSEKYQPGSPIESDLVDNMFAARWRAERVMAAENALINTEFGRQRRRQPESDHPAHLIADVFTALADNSKAYTLVTRYLSQLNRYHQQCFLILRVLRHERMANVTQPAALQPAKPDLPAPPSPVPGPEPQTQPVQIVPAPPAQTPAACVRKKIWRNEPGAGLSSRPFRQHFPGLTLRFTPQRLIQRRSIG